MIPWPTTVPLPLPVVEVMVALILPGVREKVMLTVALVAVLPLEKAAQGLKLIESREVFGKVVVCP